MDTNSGAEVLIEIIGESNAKIDALEEMMAKSQARIEELERRVNPTYKGVAP